MESYSFKHHGMTVYMALFNPIQNAAQLRQRLIAASKLPEDAAGEAERDQVDHTFVDASMVTSKLHLLTAVEHALLAQSQDALKTKTIHSEVLWALEPGTNISDSLKHFGMAATSTSLVLVHVAPISTKDDHSTMLERMSALVGANPVSLDSLGRLPDQGTNFKSLRKIYKLNGDAVLKDVEPGSARESAIVNELCVSSVALKLAA